MDNQNKSVNERWAPGGTPRERGYATDPDFASSTDYTSSEYAVDRRGSDSPVSDAATAGRTAEIRQDIDRTRADMSETLDAIQDRLRPSSMVSRAAHQAKETATDKVRQLGQVFQRDRSFDDGTANYGRNGFIDRVRDNPVPAAIAAASIAWIAFGGRTRRQHQPYSAYRHTAYGESNMDMNASSSETDSDWTGQARGSLDRTASQWRGTAQDMRYRGRQFTYQNPMTTGFIAMLGGLAIGLMLPETEREKELMGDARDSLIERGRETVKDAAQQVQRVASDVTDAAKRIVGDQSGPGEVRGADNP